MKLRWLEKIQWDVVFDKDGYGSQGRPVRRITKTLQYFDDGEWKDVPIVTEETEL